MKINGQKVRPGDRVTFTYPAKRWYQFWKFTPNPAKGTLLSRPANVETDPEVI